MMMIALLAIGFLIGRSYQWWKDQDDDDTPYQGGGGTW